MHRKAKGSEFIRYFDFVIKALKELGGSGRPPEVLNIITKNTTIPDSDFKLQKSGQTRFENQVHWARFYLVKAGYIDSSTRGVWSLTEKSQNVNEITHDRAMAILNEVRTKFAGKLKNNNKQTIIELFDESNVTDSNSENNINTYRTTLLEILQSLPPSGFERLCQRVLRESGFEQVVVTGRTGDGGIDGQGILQINPLVSFKVLFQCKRYKGSVTPSQVRDFRGAMVGRADKGIIITTGSFTTEAQNEALRDGVPQIELVNREKLLDMFENLELGLKPRQTYDIDHSFFVPFKQS